MSADNNAADTAALDLPEYVRDFLSDRAHRAHELSDILGLIEENGGGDHAPALSAAYRLALELAESLNSAYMAQLANGCSLRAVLREVRMSALGE